MVYSLKGLFNEISRRLFLSPSLPRLRRRRGREGRKERRKEAEEGRVALKWSLEET